MTFRKEGTLGKRVLLRKYYQIKEMIADILLHADDN